MSGFNESRSQCSLDKVFCLASVVIGVYLMRSDEVAHHGCGTRRIERFTDQYVLVTAFVEGVRLLLGTIDLAALDSLDHGVECIVTSKAETDVGRRDKNREGVAAVVIDELQDAAGTGTTYMLRPQVIPG
jgi:hypothetical protein